MLFAGSFTDDHMNVQTFVLANGQEVVADLVHIDERYIHLEDPLVLQQMMDPQTGRPIVGFGEWPALAKRGQVIRVPITGVLSMPVEAQEEVERSYLANTTGLSLPPAQPKILLG